MTGRTGFWEGALWTPKMSKVKAMGVGGAGTSEPLPLLPACLCALDQMAIIGALVPSDLACAAQHSPSPRDPTLGLAHSHAGQAWRESNPVGGMGWTLTRDPCDLGHIISTSQIQL